MPDSHAPSVAAGQTDGPAPTPAAQHHAGKPEPQLGFDQPVPDNGYAWWYVDAVSDDGRHGLTLIAFIGSVFSPYYAWARKRGPRDPKQHCSMNLALYGPPGRWSMTERGARALSQSPGELSVGSNRLGWDGTRLVAKIDDITAPIPRHVRGSFTLSPKITTNKALTLDTKERHTWWPIAPVARIEVTMDRPSLTWQGSAYFDSNRGSEPLEDGFEAWDWSRTWWDGGALVLYDMIRRQGGRRTLALAFDEAGQARAFDPPPEVPLPATRWWRMPRVTRAETPAIGASASVLATYEDTPFYARSLINTHLQGRAMRGVHESLNLNRFSSTWVQLMLPFRMPRLAR